MKALFIGGSGILSSATVALAVERGFDVTVLNRGKSADVRPWGPQVRAISGDIRGPQAGQLLGRETFDVVVDFIAFGPEHARADLEMFAGRVGHFVYISSASVYAKPFRRLPIYESSPTGNDLWPYSQAKLQAEEVFLAGYRKSGFPVTIVRPSHTYDRTLLPFSPHGAGPTYLARLLAGRPIVLHGDGTSLWTLTHHTDFARGLVGLLGHPAAIGDVFHITSDESLPWNEIAWAVARAARVEPNIVHVPSTQIARLDAEWGASLWGDKAHSVRFDNTKVRGLVPDFRAHVPFHEGAREIVDFFCSSPERMVVDPRVDGLLDQLASRFG